jgi:hypothetical protein
VTSSASIFADGEIEVQDGHGVFLKLVYVVVETAIM